MPNSIDVEDLAAELTSAVKDYTDDVQKGIEKEVRSTARKVKKDIKNNSPRKSGEYADGWGYTTSKKGGQITRTVYNKNKPGLTHLLEFGHAKAGGTGRVPAYPHIGPARDKYLPQMIKNIEKIIKNGG